MRYPTTPQVEVPANRRFLSHGQGRWSVYDKATGIEVAEVLRTSDPGELLVLPPRRVRIAQQAQRLPVYGVVLEKTAANSHFPELERAWTLITD